MICSHAWLKAFVPHTLDAAALGELVGRHVATLDGMRALRADLVPFVVGQVVSSEKIPDTKLSFNKVDDGSGELLDVVCGAPNVTVGAKYPFARTGTVMPGGALTIEKRKIRGFTSNGMLCSARELGLGQEHDGILTLSTDAAPGTPLLQVMPLGDTQLEFDVLANRPDLFSHLGLAREVAALTGVALVEPAEVGAVPAGATQAPDGVQIRVDAPEACPRYVGVVVRGVTVGPSPEWLKARVESVGGRSINNVVDATNYVLHGFGQPTHAFDLARLAQGHIVVREARAGETITTLDGVARTLAAGTLVIADAERPQAVAGVIGGKDSEVTDATTDLLLEIAVFEPRQVRRARKGLGISTDASYRFERGVDAAATLAMADRLAALVVQVAGGQVAGRIVCGTAPAARPAVRLSHARVERLLGDSVPVAEIERWLGAIGFACTSTGHGQWDVVPPSWRHDVTRDVDLVEDIARLRGYDALPDTLRPARPGTVPDHPLHVAGERVRAALIAAGLYEVKPLPFVAGADATHARVQNPLADDEPHLRRSLLETLAKRAEYNLSRMQGDVRLFEIGSAFERRDGSTLPVESVRAALLVMGRRRPPHFTDDKPPVFDAWDAKGLAAQVAAVAFPGAATQLVPDDVGDRLWRIEADGRAVGHVSRIALDAPVWASAAFGVEVALGELSSAAIAPAGQHAYAATAEPPRRSHVQYQPIPTQPAAEIDLALIVPDAVAAGAIDALIRETAGEMLEALVVFDEFRGPGVPDGHRSLAWRLTFRHPERTLRDKEIDGRRAGIVRALEAKLGVRPRS
ncbi:MAG: phenylalanine--tRNA ligase subunit beta [Gemmatimonadaceae bacterium]|nr:phenylalanine--tRNA ligase subunit beta [Gemmatimonadaceae bacterium]